MTTSADVVVVGGGLLGTSTAMFAARAGAEVILLEAGDLAAGASGAAFGGVSASIYSYAATQVPRTYVELSLASLALYGRLQGELGSPLDFVVCGSLDPFAEDADRDAFAERVASLRACGVDVELLDGSQVQSVEPAVSPHLAGASYCPGDGHVSPQNAVWAFADEARRRGADIRTGVTVAGVVAHGGRATGVRTSSGTIDARHVVIAAGLDTARLMATVGVEVPLGHSRGQMFVTERVPPLLETYLHSIKQTPAGTVMIGATKEPDVRARETTHRGTAMMLAEAIRFVPALAGLRLLRSWAGIRPVPVDGYPIFGFVEGIEGLLVAVMHRGVTLAPVIGQVLSDLITAGTTPLDIEPYRLGRFRGEGPVALQPVGADNY